MGKHKNEVQELLDKIIENKMKQARSDLYSALAYTNEELRIEATKMFDSLIDDFYSYKTTSYIRHGETKPGTKVGWNLYQANNIHKISNPKHPKLVIDINSEDMESKNYLESSSNVLEKVMSGIRFDNPNFYMPEMTWRGSYHGKYIDIDSLSPKWAFEIWDRDFYKISKKITLEKMNELGWK